MTINEAIERLNEIKHDMKAHAANGRSVNDKDNFNKDAMALQMAVDLLRRELNNG